MIEKRLEEHLTDFYHGQELRPQKLAELLALGENRWTRREMARVRTPAPWSWHRMFVHGRVAAAVSLLLLGAFYLGRTSRPAVPGELTDDVLARSIGREIAMNHKKQLDMEVSAGDYA